MCSPEFSIFLKCHKQDQRHKNTSIKIQDGQTAKLIVFYMLSNMI